MKPWLRLVQAIILLLSAILLAGSVVAIVGSWVVRHRFQGRVESLADQLDSGLGRAAEATRIIRGSLHVARADVALATDASIESNEERDRLVIDFFRTLVQRLRIFSEMEVAAASLLRHLQAMPLGESARANPDRLERAAEMASILSNTVRELQEKLGEGAQRVSSAELAGVADRLDDALGRCEKAVDEWQADANAIRADLPPMKVRALQWLTWVSVAVTAVGSLIGVSQVLLFALTWKWFRGT